MGIRWFGGLLLVGLWLVGVDARAQAVQPIQTIRVVVAGNCPSPRELMDELRRALPHWSVVEAGDAKATQTIEVADFGSDYRIFVGGTQKRHTEPGRHCDERARAIAVVAALALEPTAPPPQEPPQPKEPARPTEPPPVIEQPPPVIEQPPPGEPPTHFDLDAAGHFALAPYREDVLMTGGGSLRGAWTRGHLGVSFGIAGFGPVNLTFDTRSVQLLRFPVDFGTRGIWAWGALEGVADVGFVVGALSLRGMGFAQDNSTVGVDLALRLAAALRYRIGRVAPLLAVEGQIGSFLTTLKDGNTTLGTTPRVWLSVAAGISIRIY